MGRRLIPHCLDPSVSGQMGDVLGMLHVSPHLGIWRNSIPKIRALDKASWPNSSHKTLVKSLSLSFCFFVFNMKASSNIFFAGLLERRVQLKQMIEYQVYPALNRREDVMSADRGPGSNTTSFIYYHETLRRSPLRVSFVLSVK